MSDAFPASLAEAMAEIRRLRGEAATGEARLNTSVQPEYVSVPRARYLELLKELDHLRARIFALETTHTVTLGTLEQPTPDEPATYTHNVPPSAPPHDEQP